MKARATKDFSASVNGRAFACAAGDELEADAKTIEQLEAMGLAAGQKAKRARAPRKAADDD